MITIGGGFKLAGTTEPNFSRDVVADLAALRAIGLEDIDRGHIVFCQSTGKYYSFDQDGQHTADPTTGYFRELTTGGTEPQPLPELPAIVFITQTEYDALPAKDAGTLYFIVPPDTWTFGMTFPVILQ